MVLLLSQLSPRSLLAERVRTGMGATCYCKHMRCCCQRVILQMYGLLISLCTCYT